MDPILTEALSQVKLPLIAKSPIELNYVKKASLVNGVASVSLELRVPHTQHSEKIKTLCTEALKTIPDVTEVEIIIQNLAPAQKSAPTPSSSPEAAAENEHLKGVKHILAVASGKGGVGKSTVTANLASALSLQGLKVGVLDADIYGPSMNMMFNVSEAPSVLADKSVIPVTVTGGIKVISMAMFAESDKAIIWRGPMASSMIQNFISRVQWGDLDVLLIDFPPGTGDIQLTLTQNCPITGAVIVTTPQNVSVIDAKKGLQMFDTVSVPVVGVLENMSYFLAPDGSRHNIFSSGGGQRISHSLGLPFLGEVPLEPAVATGGDSGVPIVKGNPNCPAGKKFTEVADTVYQNLIDLKASEGGLGAFEYTWNELEVEA